MAKADGLNSKIVADAVLEQEAVTLVRDDPATDEEDIPRSEWEHLLEPGVLERYRDTVCRRQGVVGEVDKQVVEAVTLCMSGAQLGVLPSGKPAGSSMALLGPAGRGKNYLCDATVSIAPPEWYRAFTIASAQAFYWAAKVNPAFLNHVFIYPNEIEAVDAVTEFLRPMLSQGHAEKFVVNKDNNGAFQFEAINVEGPITGVLPTVRNKLEDQLQTRLLITELTDYEGRVQQQTQALSRQRSRTRMAEVSDEERKLWEAALRSLTATRRVIWDFADKPEFSLNNDSLEHGARLWGNLLGLAEANAFLEQNNWEVTTLEDGSEAIVADARDYEVAYRLLEATSKRSMENISDVHRKILDAVHKLQAGHTLGGWSMNKIAREAHVSSATVHRHKTFLTKSLGYLAEDEDGGLRLALGVDPSWWEKGEAMRGFPTPKEIQSWEGDTPPPESEILRNSETESQNPDTYAEKPVSQERNGSETSETAGSVVYAGKGGPGYDIYIGDRETRGGHDLPQSPWYNPFKIDKPGKKRDGTRKEVCIKYINYLNGPVENYRGRVFDGSHLLDRLMETDGQELDGKVLGCWCAGKAGAPEVLTATEPLPVHCHGQILLQAVRNIKRIAEAESPNGKVEPPAGVNVDSVGVEYETLDDEVEVF